MITGLFARDVGSLIQPNLVFVAIARTSFHSKGTQLCSDYSTSDYEVTCTFVRFRERTHVTVEGGYLKLPDNCEMKKSYEALKYIKLPESASLR